MKAERHDSEAVASGLRLVWAGPSLILQDRRHPRRGCFAFWVEELERLLDPSLGAPAFDPDDEFTVLYRAPALWVERAGSASRPLIRLSRESGQAFLLDPEEWNVLIDAH